LSGAKWLLFLGHNISRIEDFFADINIPFDCEFLVVHKEFGYHVVLTEVYRISPKLPLQTLRLGDFRHQNLYERRSNLQGLAFRSAVMESVRERCGMHVEHCAAHLAHPDTRLGTCVAPRTL
jgi:hypothetical protein